MTKMHKSKMKGGMYLSSYDREVLGGMLDEYETYHDVSEETKECRTHKDKYSCPEGRLIKRVKGKN